MRNYSTVFVAEGKGDSTAGGATYLKPREAVHIGAPRQTDRVAGTEAVGGWAGKDLMQSASRKSIKCGAVSSPFTSAYVATESVRNSIISSH